MEVKNYRWLLAPLLYPVSLVYGLIVSLRNRLFDWKILRSTKFDIPVISVGNITVGGTGKTPHVEYLINLLTPENKIAFLSRGYKRISKGYAEASKQTGPAEIGDEPFQVYRKFGNHVLVAVDEKRVRGITFLMEKYPDLNAVILDDAHQHRYVKPGFSILLIDYNRPVFMDNYLPFGRLREGLKGIDRADIVIITKVPEFIETGERTVWKNKLDLSPGQRLFYTTTEYGNLMPVFSETANTLELKAFRQRHAGVLLVAGIADPAPLIETVRQWSGNFDCIRFSDHQVYGMEETGAIKQRFARLEGSNNYIITTEKDAVKLSQLDLDQRLKERCFYLPVSIRFLENDETAFNSIIREYLAKDK
jgi:tetraacyldisaccharide 4'-kinase